MNTVGRLTTLRSVLQPVANRAILEDLIDLQIKTQNNESNLTSNTK